MNVSEDDLKDLVSKLVHIEKHVRELRQDIEARVQVAVALEEIDRLDA